MTEERLIFTAPPRPTWKDQLITFARQVGVAVVTSGVIILGLVIGFHGQTQEEVKRQEDTLHANLAIACEFALPVDLENGRDPDAVRLCFTQYGLTPPRIPSAPGP